MYSESETAGRCKRIKTNKEIQDKFDLHCEHFNFINCSPIELGEFNLEYFFGKLLFRPIFSSFPIHYTKYEMEQNFFNKEVNWKQIKFLSPQNNFEREESICRPKLVVHSSASCNATHSLTRQSLQATLFSGEKKLCIALGLIHTYIYIKVHLY